MIFNSSYHFTIRGSLMLKVSLYILLCVTIPLSVSAKDSETDATTQSTSIFHVPNGPWSISIDFPLGVNSLSSSTTPPPNFMAGIFYLYTPDINLGVNLGMAGSDGQFAVQIAPVIKNYLASTGAVRPFVLGELNYFSRDEFQEGSDTNNSGVFERVTLIGAFGAEWWITREFSIAAYTGVGFNFIRPENQVGFTTFSSGVTGQIYF